MRTPRKRTLQRILAVRALIVSLSACVALTGFFLLHYLLNTPLLRQLTLENEVRNISDALIRHKDPAAWTEFRDFPDAYAFRVFDHRFAPRRKVVAQANVALLPAPRVVQGDADDPDVTEGFGQLKGPDGRIDTDRWLITDHVDAAGHSYWIQVLMVGDPDWRWRRVIGDEMRDHVMIPVLFLIPALTGALLLTTSIALRPLGRIAIQAGALGRAVATGGALTPLSEADLPIEIGNLVAAINAMLRNLQRSFQLQKQFASDVAHELRTPLAILQLEVLRLPASPAREAITQDLTTLGSLVNQLLRFAQAEDVMARERGPVDVTAVVQRVCEDLAGVAVSRGVAFEFDAPETPVIVTGHAALIDIAVRNVLDNAIRFSPENTTVSISVHACGTVIVDDRGPGVPKEQKERIFARFWRADSSRTEGAGIGLALVSRVTHLHGGDAYVRDRPGGGARFVLCFAPQPDGTPAQAMADARPPVS